MNLKIFKTRLLLFIFFSAFLFLEGFTYYFSYKLSYLCFDTFTFQYNCSYDSIFNRFRTGFNPVIWNENGIVEIIQCLILLFTIILTFKNIKEIKNENFHKFFMIINYTYLLCILYFFFEEISWGQHFFKWDSSNFFLKYNNQNETNIHNISNIFDQLPRGLLTIWCGLSFLAYNFSNKFFSKQIYAKFIFPKNELKYISIILIIFFLPDFIIKKLNLHPGHINLSHGFIVDEKGGLIFNVNISEIFDFISFNFIKLSEYQELIFTFYLLNHALFLKEYLNHKT